MPPTLALCPCPSILKNEGKWKSGLKPAHDPEQKVLGIIGMGGIGSVSRVESSLARPTNIF